MRFFAYKPLVESPCPGRRTRKGCWLQQNDNSGGKGCIWFLWEVGPYPAVCCLLSQPKASVTSKRLLDEDRWVEGVNTASEHPNHRKGVQKNTTIVILDGSNSAKAFCCSVADNQEHWIISIQTNVTNQRVCVCVCLIYVAKLPWCKVNCQQH